MSGALDRLSKRHDAENAPAVESPVGITFREFLLEHAWVKARDGRYVRYSFEGRPVLEFIVDTIDRILGNTGGPVIQDATFDIGGGAQWGKTVLSQLLYAYLLAIKWFNVGYYLPDDDLVAGLVDTKFRPDVVDQIGWFAELIQIGKAINKSGRAVNRKGAMSVTDGSHKAQGYMRGMGKIPTSFSMDTTIVDERDDVPEKNIKFLPGRMTNSDTRFRLNVGTMRYDGAGQNAEYRKGTQHICMLTCPGCGKKINPEDNWPDIVRLMLGEFPAFDDPQLNNAGVFVRGNEQISYNPKQTWYFGCPDCGAYLDRDAIKPSNWEPQQPEREKYNHWSVRVSQLATPAIPIKLLVSDWCTNAVLDKAARRAYSVDRLAKPSAGDQQIDSAKLDRARSLEAYDLSLKPRENCVRFGGMDTGDRCWFLARGIEHPLCKRLAWLEQIAPEDVRSRVPVLFELLQLTCLFIDIGNERQLARDLCMILNKITEPVKADPKTDRIDFGNGVKWDPKKGWTGIKCACVEFSLKPGGGIKHAIRKTQAGLYYPVIQCERNESIQGVIDELLTVDDGLIEVITVDGKKQARDFPVYRLPQKLPGSPTILSDYDNHLKTGSRKEKDGEGKEAEFVKSVENHLLLATAYARLAETVEGQQVKSEFHYTNARQGASSREDRSPRKFFRRRSRRRTGVSA